MARFPFDGGLEVAMPSRCSSWPAATSSSPPLRNSADKLSVCRWFVSPQATKSSRLHGFGIFSDLANLEDFESGEERGVDSGDSG
jgi:hypothetical protein